MKKFFILCTMLGALISCSNNEIEKIEPTPKDDLISFNSLRDRVETRYANDDSSNYQIMAVVAGSSSWFINTDFIPGSSGATDKAADGSVYHWPGNSTNVTFYAFAPAPGSDTGISAIDSSLNNGAGVIDITYEVVDDADVDFTIATPLTQSSGVVAFSFSHMLSKIIIKAALADSLVKAGYTLDTDYSATLTLPSNSGTISAISSSPSWTLTSSSASNVYSGDTTYIIMPQASYTTTTTSADSCLIQILDLEIEKGDVEIFDGNLSIYGIKEGDIPENAFEMGKCYIITLTLGSNSTDSDGNKIFGDIIEFSSSVVDWNSVDVALNQP